MNLQSIKLLSFDCYGTLIDWETGILKALRPILARHKTDISDTQILQNYAVFEAEQERGRYLPYREVLKNVVHAFGEKYHFVPQHAEAEALANSLPSWQPFFDTVAALRTLKQKYQLAIISNIDTDLFAQTNKLLQVEFDCIVTAEQAKAYKPSLKIFELAHARFGCSKTEWLHAAESLYHDHVPAAKFGTPCVWINRRHNQSGFGATHPAYLKPELEFPDLQSLLSRLC